MVNKQDMDRFYDATKKIMDACNKITAMCRDENGNRRKQIIYSPDVLNFMEEGLVPVGIVYNDSGRQGFEFYEDDIRCYFIITSHHYFENNL